MVSQSSITPSVHLFDGWYFNIEPTLWDVSPVLTESKVAWSAESCFEQPDPARASFVAHVPRRVAEVLDIGVGGPVRAFVACNGMDPNGTGAVQRSSCAYQEGYVDQVTKRRLKYLGQGDLTRIPYHSVASRYRMTSANTTGMWTGLYNRIGHVATLQDTAWSPSGLGAQRIRLTNSSGSAKSFIFQVEFQVNMNTTRWDDASGASGTAVPGKFLLGVTQRYFGGEITISYGGSTWPYFGTVTLTAPMTTLVATISLTLASGEVAELVPALAQTQPYAEHSETIELLIETSDALAKMGRVFIASEGRWYVESAASRIDTHLAPQVAASGLSIDAWPFRDHMGYEAGADATMNVDVRFVDYDNQSALEVYRRVVAAAGRVPLGLAGRVGISWALKPATRISVGSGTATLQPNPGYMSVVATDSLEDPPLQRGIDKMSNRITAAHYVATAADPYIAEAKTTTQAAASVNRYGSVTHTIETDLYVRAGQTFRTTGANLWAKMELVRDARSDPAFYLDSETWVVPSDLDSVVGFAELIDNSQRFGRLVQLTGPLPHDVSPYQRVRGGTFGFSADGRWHLALLLEPSDFSGVEAGRFLDANTRTDLTFNTFKTSSVRLYEIRSSAL